MLDESVEVLIAWLTEVLINTLEEVDLEMFCWVEEVHVPGERFGETGAGGSDT